MTADRILFNTDLDSTRGLAEDGKAFVKVDGTSIGYDANGNLKSLGTSTFKFSKEWHVDPVNGNDTTGTGSLNAPYKTITAALAVVGNTGESLFLHSGTYTEAVTVTALNLDIRGAANSGLVNVTGNWSFNNDSSSVRVDGLRFNGNVNFVGAGSVYLNNCGCGAVQFAKSNSAYVEVNNSDLGSSTAIGVSNGQMSFNGGRQSNVDVNGASAVVSIVGSLSCVTPTVSTGMLMLENSIVFSISSNGNAVVAYAPTVLYLNNCEVSTPSGTSARISVSGAYSINNSRYDHANSAFNGTNLGTVTSVDALRLLVQPSTITTAAKYLVRDPSDGSIKEQAGSVPQRTFTSASAITSGRVVELLQNGTVQEQAIGGISASATWTYLAGNATDLPRVLNVPAGSCNLYFYRDNANSSYLTYRVGTYTGTTISYATAVVLTSVKPSSYSVVYDPISTNVIVFFSDGAASNVVKYVVLTRSGTTFSAGSVSAAISAAGVATSVSAVFLGAGKFVVSYVLGGTAYARTGTLDTSTVTLDAGTVDIGSSATAVEVSYCTSTRAFIGLTTSSAASVNTINTATFTVGTAVSIGLGALNPTVIYSGGTYSVVYEQSGSTYSKSVTDANSVLTLGTSLQIGSATSHVRSGPSSAIVYSITTSGYITLAKFSGGLVSCSRSLQLTGSLGYNFYCADTDAAGNIWIMPESTVVGTGNQQPRSQVLTFSADVGATVIGVAQNTVAASASVSVALLGDISSVHTGLVPGTQYYVIGGTLTTTDTGVPIGVAISSTELEVNPPYLSSPTISGSVLDNTVPTTSFVTVGRYIVPVGDVSAKDNFYADYDGTGIMYTAPASGDRVQLTSGANAGQVWVYSGSAWIISSQTTGLPLYTYSLAAAYKANDVVLYNQAVYQANAAIPANTAFMVGVTGATWRQIGVSGASDSLMVSIPAQTTAALSNVWVDVTESGFTLSTAGEWIVNYDISLAVSNGNYVAARIVDTAGNEVTGSGAQFAGIGNSVPVQLIRSGIKLATTGATYYKIQVKSYNAGVITISNGSPGGTGVQGSSFVSYVKISGYLPTIGSICDYGQYGMTGLQTTANAKIGLAMSDGNLPVVSDTITLKAGNTYLLEASLAIWSTYYTFRWWNETSAAFVGIEGFCASANSTDGGSYCPATYTVRPATDTAFSLRVVGNVGVNTGQSALDIRYSTISVRQLGSSPQIAPPANAKKVGTDASSNFTSMAAAALVGRGVVVQLGNLKVRIPATGNVSLQIAAASGTMAITGSAVWVWSGNSTNGSNTAAPMTVTTAWSYLASTLNFTSASSSETWLLMDDTSGLAWRLSAVYGNGYIKNLVSIERLV